MVTIHNFKPHDPKQFENPTPEVFKVGSKERSVVPRWRNNLLLLLLP